MNHSRILSRAWKILWSYRALWGFGILIALASARGGNNGSSMRFSGGNNGSFNPPADFERGLNALGRWLERAFTPQAMDTAIVLGIALVCLIFLAAVLFRILFYVSHVSLIRMVDRHETDGEKLGFRQGFRLGWSRAAWRLFLVDLVIFLPLALILFGLIGCGLLFFFMTNGGSREPSGFGIVGLIGFVFVLIFVGLIIGLALSLVVSLIRRYAVLHDLGVFDSIRAGFGLLRRRFVDVLLMWLILLGIAIGFAILLIPVVLLLVGIGLVIAGPLAALAYFLARSGGDAAAVIAALAVGLPLFIAILAVPLTFLEGLRQVYESSVWTLVFRELTLPAEIIAGEDALAPLPSTDATVVPEADGAQVFPAE